MMNKPFIIQCGDLLLFVFFFTAKKYCIITPFICFGSKIAQILYLFVKLYNSYMIMNNTHEVSDVIEFLHDLTQKIRYISS